MTRGGLHNTLYAAFCLPMSSHAPSHDVNCVCQQPFLLLFRPGLLHYGSCLPKGGPHGPANMFLMLLVRIREKNKTL